MRLALSLILLGSAAFAKDHILYIEFFGYEGLDLPAIRQALPVHEGDAMKKDTLDRVKTAASEITGRKADVGATCCVGDGDFFLTVGLRPPAAGIFYSAPTGSVRVPAELAGLYRKMDKAEEAAFARGVYEEVPGKGYRLSKDPAAGAAETAVRNYAQGHEADLLEVLKSARDPEQRQIAADAIGLANPSDAHLADYIAAAGDPDSTVRNNVTRALGEMAMADPALGAKIPLDRFLVNIRAGSSTDLNKVTLLLADVTQSRDPKMLARIKAEDYEALWQFARWRITGWNFAPRLILARVAGVPEEQAQILSTGPLEDFLKAVPYSTTLAPERHDR
jgi:hypothetical protein